MRKLEIYADRMSQPCRAVLIFCKINGIEFEEFRVDIAKRQQVSPAFQKVNPLIQLPTIVDGRFKLTERSLGTPEINGIEFKEFRVDIAKRQQLSPEFQEVNPLTQLPTIVDGRFKLTESHAILKYLACAFPGVADHWYPSDLTKRAKIDAVLDWHHSSLRRGSVALVKYAALAPAVGLRLNPYLAAEGEKLLSASLEKIESIWLKGTGKFLLGSSQPSIADLSLVCEIMQLEVLDEKHRDKILGPHDKVKQWIDDTKLATRPHFQEINEILFRVKERLHKQRLLKANSEIESSMKDALHSKL